MPLKIELKPGERIIVGGGVISVKASAELLIENQVPILRQKNIMREEEATTPCRKIYYAIQLMYIDPGDLAMHHDTYWGLVRDVLKAAPSTLPLIDQINDDILNNRHYHALKLAKKLIQYEEEAVAHAIRPNRNV